MGLLTGLVTLPLLPVRGAIWVADQLASVAEDSYFDVETIYEQLRQLEHELAAGRLTEAEFDRAEDVLLQRLQEAAEHQSRPR